MKAFYTDRYVYRFIIDPLLIHFQNMNPNYVTIFSMPLSFCIFLLNYCYPFGLIFAVVTNILRTLCDFLDGQIARKYNKCSKLGAFLDSVADCAHSVNYVMFLVYIFKPIGMTFWTFCFIWVLLFVFGFLCLWKKGIVLDHDEIQKLSNSPLDIFIAIGKYDGLLLNLFVLFTLVTVNFVYSSA